MSDKITFIAEVVRVKTMADGGLRFELGVGENYIMQAAQLMECKRAGVALQVNIEPILTELDDETEKSAEGSSTEMDGARPPKRRDKRARGGV
jgi:hypothetical protein